MKQLVILFGILAAFISCNSCDKKTPIVPVIPDAAPIVTETVFTKDNCQVTTPPYWIDDTSDVDSVMLDTILYAHSKDDKTVIILNKENFTGTLQEYTAVSARLLRDQGAQTISSSEVQIDATKYVLLEASKNETKAWLWATIINKTGYALSCAGTESDRATCFAIANSLVIKK